MLYVKFKTFYTWPNFLHWFHCNSTPQTIFIDMETNECSPLTGPYLQSPFTTSTY